MNVRCADSNVIHDSTKALIRIRSDIYHEFEPIHSIRYLHGDPVGLIVLHAAMPVGAEAENVFVEMLRGGAVVDDEAGMDDLKFFFGLPRESRLQIVGLLQEEDVVFFGNQNGEQG